MRLRGVMATVLFTGFPGFLGCALLPLVLAARPGDTAVCVVQAHHGAIAAQRLAEIMDRHPHVAGRVALVPGDITQTGLGVEGGLPDDIGEVFHLAAVYDLAVPEDVARRVNVEGTANVLEVCRAVDGLTRLHHVSTCYVSGSYDGVFTEDDLDVGQEFQNHYERTKFESEVLVREAMGDGLPATVYRPGIVVGDSTTGDTQKFDGPYFMANFLLMQPRHAVVPRVADPDRIVISLVPRDFVVHGIAELSTTPESEGRTYALVDPTPPTVRHVVDTFADLLGKDVHWVPVPLGITRRALGLSGLERLLGFPEEALAYFAHPTRYDTRRASADLAHTCPPFDDYAPIMMDFVRAHPEVSSQAMV